MTERDEDELVACPECGREGLPERIERTACPHLGLEHRVRGIYEP